jgi:hypothetical protein
MVISLLGSLGIAVIGPLGFGLEEDALRLLDSIDFGKQRGRPSQLFTIIFLTRLILPFNCRVRLICSGKTWGHW